MRNRIMLVIPAVVAAAVAGCGSVHATPAGPPGAAAATAATSSRVVMTVTTGAPGMPVTFTGTGAFDYARSRGWLRIGGAGFGFEERFLPPRMYVKLPGGIPDARGKAWLAATVAGAGGSRNVPLMFPGPQAPPADLLSLLSAASRVRDLGTATIGGIRVTHYQASVDIAKAVSRARPAAQGRLRGLAALLGARTIPADAWVDGKGRVRRIQVKLSVPGAKAGGSGFTMTETVTYSDFGVPVRVTAPPAADAASVSSLGPGSSLSSMIGNGSASAGTATP